MPCSSTELTVINKPKIFPLIHGRTILALFSPPRFKHCLVLELMFRHLATRTPKSISGTLLSKDICVPRCMTFHFAVWGKGILILWKAIHLCQFLFIQQTKYQNHPNFFVTSYAKPSKFLEKWSNLLRKKLYSSPKSLTHFKHNHTNLVTKQTLLCEQVA